MDYSIPILFSPLPQLPTPTPSKPVSIVAKTTPAHQKKPNSITTPKTRPIKPVTTTTVKTLTTEPVKTATITAPVQKTETKKIAEPAKKVVPDQTIKPVTPPKIEPLQKPQPKKDSTAPGVEKKEAIPVNAQPFHHKPENKLENAHVCNNFREVEALRRGAQLQKELVQKWQPPLGVSPDCACDISLFVNKKGAIENLKMVKSSGIMMFDISARQALFAMRMPQWTYGKPLIINFKQ